MPKDDPVENKFDVLVEAIKKLVRLFSLEAGRDSMTTQVAQENLVP